MSMSNRQTGFAGNPGWSGSNETHRRHGPKCKPFAPGVLVRLSSHSYPDLVERRVGVVIRVIEDLTYPDEYEVLLVGASETCWLDWDEIECATNGRGER